MPISHPPLKKIAVNCRRGFSLPELLCAAAILTLLAGAIGTLSYGIGNANDYCRGQTEAAQQARVALERIRYNVINCKASESFPGCMMVSTTVGAYSYPDRLLIWKSNGVAAGATELPKQSDLVAYTYNPSRPTQLLEVTSADPIPLVSTTQVALNAAVDAMLASPTSTKTVITDRLGIATTDNSTSRQLSDLLANSASRGMLRFHILMSPTDTQWSQYKASSLAWSNIDWPLDQYGSSLGNRRVSCQTEIQILADDSNTLPPVPFFGSATKVYQLAK